MGLDYIINGDVTIDFFYDSLNKIAFFDIKDNVLIIQPNLYLEFAEIEFIYNILKEKL